jgi:hypothetical protein
MMWLWLILSLFAACALGCLMAWILKGTKALSFVLAFCLIGYLWLVVYLLPYTDTFH